MGAGTSWKQAADDLPGAVAARTLHTAATMRDIPWTHLQARAIQLEAIELLPCKVSIAGAAGRQESTRQGYQRSGRKVGASQAGF